VLYYSRFRGGMFTCAPRAGPAPLRTRADGTYKGRNLTPMENRDKLYRLYAKIPGSIYHVRFTGYDYIDPGTQEKRRGNLLDVDIAIYGFLYMHSDMRNFRKGGTGQTHWFSAKSVSDASRADTDPRSKPAWSVSTVKRSLARLRAAGYVKEIMEANAKRKVKLADPAWLPSRQRIMEAEALPWKPSES